MSFSTLFRRANIDNNVSPSVSHSLSLSESFDLNPRRKRPFISASVQSPFPIPSKRTKERGTKERERDGQWRRERRQGRRIEGGSRRRAPGCGAGDSPLLGVLVRRLQADGPSLRPPRRRLPSRALPQGSCFLYPLFCLCLSFFLLQGSSLSW